MAKQVIILVISLSLLIFSGIWEINYLERTSKYMMSDIDYTINSIENNNFDMAKEQVESLEKTWDDMKTVWNIFVNHERVDALEETMVQLKAYIDEEDKDESISSAEKLYRIVEQIVEKQKFSLEHVL